MSKLYNILLSYYILVAYIQHTEMEFFFVLILYDSSVKNVRKICIHDKWDTISKFLGPQLCHCSTTIRLVHVQHLYAFFSFATASFTIANTQHQAEVGPAVLHECSSQKEIRRQSTGRTRRQIVVTTIKCAIAVGTTKNCRSVCTSRRYNRGR